MNFPKPSGQNKAGEDIWVLYNAWQRRGEAARADEAGVDEEALCAVRALGELGRRPEVYAFASVADLAVRTSGAQRPRLVVNLAEGFRGNSGREMHVAALLELLEIPYTGNSAKTLAVAQDKVLTKRLLASAGIPTPGWTVFAGGEAPETGGLAFPLIAKPSREDASLGISPAGVFSSPVELREAARELFAEYRQPILIEEFIDGREINAAILENEGKPFALPFSEILFDGLPAGSPRITSYEAKWNEKSPWYTGTPALCPAPLDGMMSAELEKTALAVFALLEGKDYGRVDFRLDSAGKPWALEYNPNPDISPGGGFARSLAAGGFSPADFMRILLRNNHYA
jgi:D-alanine-D-alanine ligase